MNQPNRLQTGGRIDRSSPIEVDFDGHKLAAFKGDTLGAALLANDCKIVARSFKYHRPRGVYSAGVEEPNAMVHLRTGSRHEPNARATVVEVFENLKSSGQNAWPNVRYDISAVHQLMSPFFSAGFYYKTFIGPGQGTGFWMFCEKFIRKAAGMGSAVKIDDPDCYEKINAHCDVLVIGAGPAGLTAALAAGKSGARVMLIEQDPELGGSLLSARDGSETDLWLSDLISELEKLDNVQILRRATVFGAYDNDVYGVVERVWDHVETPPEFQPRQRYWQIRTKQSVMATGAIERPMVFGGNDKPGVMLSGSVRTYINRYAVLPGKNAIVVTNNDSAYATAQELARAGAKVTLVDSRSEIPANLRAAIGELKIDLRLGYGVLVAKGLGKVTAAQIVPIDETGRATGTLEKIACDLIAISGGWTPVVHIWSQRSQKPIFDNKSASFVPSDTGLTTMKCAGSAMACGSLDKAISQGKQAGEAAAIDAGFKVKQTKIPACPHEFLGDDWARDLVPVWVTTKSDGRVAGKAFVDMQHDVTLSDIDLAHREGYVSVEHLKRYTTTGMATDQGKLSNVNALARMAQLQSVSIPEVGTTTFRPPYTPVTIGALVGHGHALHFQPTRLSPAHDWHIKNGAEMTEAGAWKRPWYYPKNNETVDTAYHREANHVRNHVGIVDVSTLGKISVQGPDTAEFLNRIYVNGWKALKTGRIRYGVMLRDDGFVLDDGTTARLSDNDYFMTTTTANAAKILGRLEHLLQTAWRDLKVHVTSVTDQYGAYAIAGPKARDLLVAAGVASDISSQALPNNHLIQTTMDSVPVRIHRMSYSGELAYEIYIPAGFAHQVWESLMEVGKAFNLQPYGTEAMSTLRIEKGHVAGPEIDGRTTLKDLSLEGFARSQKTFAGSVLRQREKLVDPQRPSLVGLEIAGNKGAKAGSLLYVQNTPHQGHGDGHLTSTTYSPALGKNIALALLANGSKRMGETIQIADFVSNSFQTGKVVSPHFFDPKGVRQNA